MAARRPTTEKTRAFDQIADSGATWEISFVSFFSVLVVGFCAGATVVSLRSGHTALGLLSALLALVNAGVALSNSRR